MTANRSKEGPQADVGGSRERVKVGTGPERQRRPGEGDNHLLSGQLKQTGERVITRATQIGAGTLRVGVRAAELVVDTGRAIARDPAVIAASVHNAVERGRQAKEWTTETLAEARRQLREVRHEIYRQTFAREVQRLDDRTTHFLTGVGKETDPVDLKRVVKILSTPTKQVIVNASGEVPRDGFLGRRKPLQYQLNRDLVPVRDHRQLQTSVFDRQLNAITEVQPAGFATYLQARRDHREAIRLDLPRMPEVRRARTLARIDAGAAARQGNDVAVRQATVLNLHALGDTRFAKIFGERLRVSNMSIYHQSEVLRRLLGRGALRRDDAVEVVARLYRLGDIKGALQGEKIIKRRYGNAAA